MGKKMKNPHEYTGNFTYTACVGINGGTTDLDIKMGFEESVKAIFSMIQKERKEDILVYPMMYCIRHSVELSLKIIIKYIIQIKLIKTPLLDIRSTEKVLGDHSIKVLNDHIISISEFDERLFAVYEPIVKYLEPYYIDSKSDMYRYAQDKQGGFHMEIKGIQSIDVELAYGLFQSYCYEINKVIDRLQAMLYEYNMLTFTANMSREQIKSISLEIGDIKAWKVCKEEIKNRYGISSNELSKVVNIIKKHPEFSKNINIENVIYNISDDSIDAYNTYSKRMKDLKKMKNKYMELICVGEEYYDEEQRKEIENEFLERVSFEDIIFLVTCIEMAKRNYYSEEYATINKEIKNSYCNSEMILYKLGFGNLSEELISGLNKCGQRTIADKIILK